MFYLSVLHKSYFVGTHLNFIAKAVVVDPHIMLIIYIENNSLNCH